MRHHREPWPEPPSFKPKKCPACGQSVRTGRRRNKWGYPGVAYNRRDRCFHGVVRIGKVARGVTRCARSPSEAAKLRGHLIQRLIRQNRIAKAANRRWNIKRGRERSAAA